MAPAEILPIEPGDRVLDLCAAPGGKSTAIADRLGGTGILVSNDISASRCKALLKNVELSGTENAVVLSEDPSRLSARFDSFFDKILIDAPCSGEGMFRKDPAVIKSWEEHGNDFYVRLQRSILESAVRMLKPGGMLLYSTCTFAPEEDEEAVLYALSLDPELKIADIPDRFSGFDPGLTEIQGRTVLELSKAVRIYPHRLSGEGHFAALMQKDGASDRNGLSMPSLLAEKPGFKALPAEVREFLFRIRKPFFEGNFEVRNGWVSYRTALSDELLKGLRILRNGLLLGECRKDRFEPSQALAMALSAEEFDSVVSFPASDERVLKYLRGETIEADSCANGWVLVALDRYPLGFAKASNGVLKNKYLPGWRYQ